jgi:hypothetical protein
MPLPAIVAVIVIVVVVLVAIVGTVVDRRAGEDTHLSGGLR